MATTITKSVGILSGGGSSGRDYTTVAAAIAALKAGTTDLVASDQAWVIELYNDGGVIQGAATLSGITVDATRFVTIRAAAGHSFKDHASKLTNPLRYDPTYGVAWSAGTITFTISADYTLVEGLQIYSGGGSGSVAVDISGSIPNVLVRNCIIQTNDSSTGGGALRSASACTVINCVAINTAGGTGFTSSGGSTKFYACTAFQTGSAAAFGFRGSYDTPLYLDCAAFGFGTNFRSGTSGSSNYNASADTSAPGANSVKSLTASAQFENVASLATLDLRVKTGHSLNFGTRAQTQTADLDIMGSARSTTTPTVGAWEYSNVAPTYSYAPRNGVRLPNIVTF